MTTVSPGDAHQRQRLLRAIGITPWLLRESAKPASSRGREEAVPPGIVPCVILLPAGASTRELDLLGRALYAAGADVARAARVQISSGLDAIPAAFVYLAFGEAPGRVAQARAGAVRSAHVIVADTPGDLLRDSGAKRRLWQRLRELRRALRETS